MIDFARLRGLAARLLRAGKRVSKATLSNPTIAAATGQVRKPSDALPPADQAKFRAVEKLIGEGQVIIPRIGSPILESPFCAQQRIRWAKFAASQFGGSFGPDLLDPLLRNAGIGTEGVGYLTTKYPLAVLTLPSSLPAFLAEHDKLAKMVKLAKKRGYKLSLFDYDAYLDDIFAINTSKSERQGRPMAQSYQSYPTKRGRSANFTSAVSVQCLGVFKDGRLYAYCVFETCGEISFVNMLLGHGEHLQDGIMYLLFLGLVQYGMQIKGLRYFNYLTLHSSTPGLDDFKRQVGFEERVVLVDPKTFEDLPPPLAAPATPKDPVTVVPALGARDPSRHFTLSSYETLLRRLIKAGVTYDTFGSFSDAMKAGRKTHYLKHDIHKDLPACLAMAKLEQSLGVKATYFMMPRHAINNAFFDHEETWKTLREIEAMGHDIAVHLDLFELFREHGDIVRGANAVIDEMRAKGLSVRGANCHGNTRMWQAYKIDQRVFFKEFYYETSGWDPAWAPLVARWSWQDIKAEYWADSAIAVQGQPPMTPPYLVSDNSGTFNAGSTQAGTWEYVSGRYDIDAGFMDSAIPAISKGVCVYLVHPQYFREEA